MSSTEQALLRAVNVTKRFGALTVLDRVDLTVRRGEVVCIVGPSGSGKSTLLRSISQLEDIDSGAIWFEDELLGYHFRRGRLVRRSERDLTRQRRRTGMVFQQFNLFAHMTALENVRHAPAKVRRLDKKEADERGREYLRKVGLLDRADHYPSELSGGQQQRVAIARALAMEPELLLFDEPTSALDPQLVDEVLLTIKQLAEDGYTMVIVTHEMRFAGRVADRIAVMNGGSVVEYGTPDEVFDSDEPRARAFLDARRDDIGRNDLSKGLHE